MVNDIPEAIVNESIRRAIDDCFNDPLFVVAIVVGKPEDYQKMRRLAALNAVMRSIIVTAPYN